MPTNKPTFDVSRFLGINNRAQETRAPGDDTTARNPGWLTAADNVDIDDSGGVGRANGAIRRDPDIASIYMTRDRQRAYRVTAAGLLQQFDGTPLATVGPGPYHWCDLGNRTYLHAERPHVIGGNQASSIEPWGMAQPLRPAITAIAGLLLPATYRVTVTYDSPTGRESGAPAGQSLFLRDGQGIRIARPVEATGQWSVYITPPANATYYRAWQGTDAAAELIDPGQIIHATLPLTTLLVRPPLAKVDAIAPFNGRLFLALIDTAAAFTRLFPSLPLDPHRYHYDASPLGDPIAGPSHTAQSGAALGPVDVPGAVTVLAATPTALLIGTDRGLYSLDPAHRLTMIAPYGAPAGRADYHPDTDRAVVMTHRGIAQFPPLELLHDNHYSAAIGTTAAVVARHLNGYLQILACTHSNSGVTGNSVTERNPRTDRLIPEQRP